MNKNFNEDVEIFDLSDYLDKSALINDNSTPPKSPNKIISALLFLIIICLLGIYAYKSAPNFLYDFDTNETVANEVSFDDKTKDVTIDTVVFHIPENVLVESYEKYFTLQDEASTYFVRVDIKDGNFSSILENYASLKGNNNSDYNSSPSIKKYNDKTYITIETAKKLGKVLMAYKDAKEGKIMIINVINKKNTYDYALLEKYSNILNTVG